MKRRKLKKKSKSLGWSKETLGKQNTAVQNQLVRDYSIIGYVWMWMYYKSKKKNEKGRKGRQNIPFFVESYDEAICLCYSLATIWSSLSLKSLSSILSRMERMCWLMTAKETFFMFLGSWTSTGDLVSGFYNFRTNVTKRDLKKDLPRASHRIWKVFHGWHAQSHSSWSCKVLSSQILRHWRGFARPL